MVGSISQNKILIMKMTKTLILFVKNRNLQSINLMLTGILLFFASDSFSQVDCGNPVFNDCPTDQVVTITDPNQCTIAGNWTEPIDADDDCNAEGFVNLFQPANWTFSLLGGDGTDGTVDESNVPNEIILTGTTDGTSGVFTNTVYCIDIPSDGTLSFDWEAIILPDGTSGFLLNDEPGYFINGVETFLYSGGDPSASGSESLELDEGDNFCFSVRSLNSGSNAQMTVDNFVFDQIEITQTIGPAPTDLLGVGEYTITYEAENSSDNVTECTFTLTINDPAPSIVCPSDFTTNITDGTCLTTLFWNDPVVADNCPIIPANLVQLSGADKDSSLDAGDGSQVGPGTYVITYEYTDAGNQSDECTFVVTVEDDSSVAPVFTFCPSNLTVSTEDDATCSQTAFWEDARAMDDCNFGGFQGSLSPFAWLLSFEGPAGGDDGSVDVSAAPASIEMQGTSNGTAGDNTDTKYCLTVAADNVLTFDWLAETMGGGMQLSNDEPAYSIDGVETILATGTDASANGSEEISLTSGQEFCFIVKSNNQFSITQLTISNISYDQVTVTQTSGPTPDSAEGANDGEAIPTGVHEVVYTATDGEGNESTCTFYVTVNDEVDPEFTICPDDINIDLDPLECEAEVIFADPEASDVCDNTGFSGNFNLGEWILSFDGSTGNDGYFDATSLPVLMTIVGTTNGVAGENTDTKYCIEVFGDGNIDFDWFAEAMGGGAQLNNDEPAYSINGVETILATGAISTDNGSESIAVADGDEFCFIVKSNNQAATTHLEISNFIQNTLRITQTDATGISSGDIVENGSYTLVFEAEDAAGNTSECTFDVNINEFEIDAVLCREDINLSLDEINCEGILTPEMTLMGDQYGCLANCEITITNDHGDEVPNFFTSADVGHYFDYMICCQDNCCWGRVYIQDEVAPSIDCPDVEISCVEGLDAAALPTTIDNCGADVVLVNQEYNQINCMDFTGEYIRTWKAIDIAGNESAECVQTVSLRRVDVNAAVIPNSSSLNIISCNDIGFDEELPVDYLGVPSLGGIDLYPFEEGVICNGYVDYSDELVAQTPCKKIMRRTWEIGEWWCNTTVTKEGIQFIEIRDDVMPTISGISDMSVSTSDFDCKATVNLPTAMISDLCSDIKYVEVNWDGGSLSSNGGVAMFEAGVHTVTYTAVDICDNVGEATIQVTVRDEADPITVCDQFTTIGILPDGTTHLTAEDVDDGSFDECTAVDLEIRRMDDPCGNNGTEWSDRIYFCCEDINSEIMVILRATDEGGNSNMCMVSIEVQDKVQSILECPANLVRECDFAYDPENLSTYFGVPVISGGGCLDLSSVAQDSVIDINSCGIGSISRTFTLSQPITGDMSCTQTIVFENNNPFDETGITWPSNFTSTDACSVDAITPEIAGRPVIDEGICDQAAMTFEDSEYEFNVDGSCAKYIRTWTVMDWCQRVGGSFRTWTFDQTIKLLNPDKPEFVTIPQDTVICSYVADCGPLTIDEIIVAESRDTDNCTDSLDLLRRYTVYNIEDPTDPDDDSFVKTSSGHNVSGTFANGLYRVEYYVEDLCGNFETAESNFEIKNCKAPVAYCMVGLSTQLEGVDLDPSQPGDESEEAIVNAAMFDNGSYHTCGYTLQFSFSEDVNDDEIVFDCDDIGRQTVELWVTDSEGNTSKCETYIDVIDDNNVDICQPRLGLISGRISTEDEQNIGEVMVELENSELNDAMSDEFGEYAFPEMPLGGAYIVNPNKDGDDAEGVSTLDIVLIQRHVLGLSELDSPFKMIAADVNADNKISASDLVQIRKLVLGLNAEFPDNTSWRFVDKQFDFMDDSDPFLGPIQEKYLIEYFDNNMNIDFVGVKIGDVNSSIDLDFNKSKNSSERYSSSIDLTYKNNRFSKDEIFSIPFYVNEGGIMLGGFQISLDLNKLEFINITSGQINLLKEHVYFDNNILNISWNSSGDLVKIDSDSPIFWLEVQASESGYLKKNIEEINEVMKSEIYFGDQLQVADLNLASRSNQAFSGFKVEQNKPNPFRSLTQISFELPYKGEVEIRIFDLSGKRLYSNKIVGDKGFNSFSIHKNEINSRGVLSYQLKFEDMVQTKKMILIE